MPSSRSFMGLWRFKTTTTKLCKTYKKSKVQVTQISEVAVSFGEGFRIFHGLVPVCLVALRADFIVAPSSKLPHGARCAKRADLSPRSRQPAAPSPLAEARSPFVLAQELLLRCPVLRLCPLRCRVRSRGQGCRNIVWSHSSAVLPGSSRGLTIFQRVSHLNAAFLADAFLPRVTK